MLIYVIVSSYSGNHCGGFLGVTDNRKNADAIRDGYCAMYGADSSKIKILTYDFNGEDNSCND